jgi:hypothetical protein
MKIAALAVSMLVMASVYAQPPLSDEKQILKLEDGWARALKTKDRQLLDAIVAPNFTFIEPYGTEKNRDEYLADRSSDIADLESSSLPILKSVCLKIARQHQGSQNYRTTAGQALPLQSSLERALAER